MRGKGGWGEGDDEKWLGRGGEVNGEWTFCLSWLYNLKALAA